MQVLSYQGEVRQGRQGIVAKLQEVLQQQQGLAGLQGSSSAGQVRPVWRVGSVDSQQVAAVSCGGLLALSCVNFAAVSAVRSSLFVPDTGCCLLALCASYT
jgi:hypothetical protein